MARSDSWRWHGDRARAARRGGSPRAGHRDGRRRRLRLEPLEDRRLLATFQVTSIDDAGAGSLRQAMLDANASPNADTITFDPAVFSTPQTIAIGSQLPTITAAVDIVGPGAELLTIDAGNGADGVFGTGDGWRILYFSSDTSALAFEASISGLTLTGGDVSSGRGGAVASDEVLTVSGCVIVSNAARRGGAINIGTNGGLLLVDSVLHANAALNEGGGIAVNQFVESLILRGSTLSDNSAGRDGGGIYISPITERAPEVSEAGEPGEPGPPPEPRVRVENSTLHGNTADDDGGGMYVGILTAVSQSTFSNNAANRGGGAFFDTPASTVTQSTFSGNVATSGGGLFASRSIVSIPSISNSIFADSTGGDVYGQLTGAYNLIEDGSGGLADTITGDPLLGPLADNGGPTLTHAPLFGSPVIDAGDPAVAYEPGEFDQRGAPYARVSGGRVDLGAVELGQIVVNSTADDTTPDDGLTTLREAILAANATYGGDAITFDPAVFSTPQTIAIGSTLPAIRAAVNIIGPGPDMLTIDAGNGADGIFGTGDGWRTFTLTGGLYESRFESLISGLTITGGDSRLPESGASAIYAEESLTISDCIIIRNASNGSLGGATVFGGYGGTLTIIDSVICENEYTGEPHAWNPESSGVITSFNSSLEIRNSTISRNRSPGGGGIRASTTLSITDSTIAENIGGGITTGGGPTTIVNTHVAGNSGYRGGGIRYRGPTTIIGSTISGNTATDSGGGIGRAGLYSYGADKATLQLISTTVSGNHAPFGGGIKIGSPAGPPRAPTADGGNDDVVANADDPSIVAEIIDCTISGNTADEEGGGVWAIFPTRISGSTIAGNAAATGGGVYKVSSTTPIELTNSIIANSTGGDVRGQLTGAYNLIEDGSGGLADTIAGDPLLGPLADNGGPTLTHALLPGSPALDAGDPGVVDPPAFDQRGEPFARVVGVIDLGAYEAQGAVTAAPGDYNRDGLVNAADYTVWRNSLGAPGPGGAALAPLTGADGDGDGAVTSDDYDVWRSHYGLSYTLPEPAEARVALASVVEAPAVEAPAAEAPVTEVAAPPLVRPGFAEPEPAPTPSAAPVWFAFATAAPTGPPAGPTGPTPTPPVEPFVGPPAEPTLDAGLLLFSLDEPEPGVDDSGESGDAEIDLAFAALGDDETADDAAAPFGARRAVAEVG